MTASTLIPAHVLRDTADCNVRYRSMNVYQIPARTVARVWMTSIATSVSVFPGGQAKPVPPILMNAHRMRAETVLDVWICSMLSRVPALADSVAFSVKPILMSVLRILAKIVACVMIG